MRKDEKQYSQLKEILNVNKLNKSLSQYILFTFYIYAQNKYLCLIEYKMVPSISIK